jgi:hypothetical protein
VTIQVVACSILDGDTITIPRHRKGDLVILFAFRRDSTTPPGNVTKYLTSGGTSGANGTSQRVKAFRSLGYDAGVTSWGPFTSATCCGVAIFRSSDPERYTVVSDVGAAGSGVGQPDLVFGAQTPADTGTLYRHLLIGCHQSNNGNISAAVAGATLLAASNLSNSAMAIHLVDTPAAGFAGATAAIAATAAASRMYRTGLYESPLYPGGWVMDPRDGGTLVADLTSRNRSVKHTGGMHWSMDVRRAKGKYYGEIYIATQSVAASTNAGLGVRSHDVDPAFFQYFGNGDYYDGNAPSVGLLETYSALDTICFAIDTVNNLVWFRKNAGNWNNNASADPATGVGGFSPFGTSTLERVTLETTAFSTLTQTHVLRERFADFAFSVPSGFNEFYFPQYLEHEFFRMM